MKKWFKKKKKYYCSKCKGLVHVIDRILREGGSYCLECGNFDVIFIPKNERQSYEDKEKSPCSYCGIHFSKGEGITCSYHNWFESVYCSKCGEPRYSYGEDRADADAPLIVVICNDCLDDRKKAIEMINKVF